MIISTYVPVPKHMSPSEVAFVVTTLLALAVAFSVPAGIRVILWLRGSRRPLGDAAAVLAMLAMIAVFLAAFVALAPILRQ